MTGACLHRMSLGPIVTSTCTFDCECVHACMHTDDLNMCCAFHRLRFAHTAPQLGMATVPGLPAPRVVHPARDDFPLPHSFLNAYDSDPKNCGATALPHESFCSCHVPPHLMHAAGAHRRMLKVRFSCAAAHKNAAAILRRRNLSAAQTCTRRKTAALPRCLMKASAAATCRRISCMRLELTAASHACSWSSPPHVESAVFLCRST